MLKVNNKIFVGSTSGLYLIENELLTKVPGFDSRIMAIHQVHDGLLITETTGLIYFTNGEKISVMQAYSTSLTIQTDENVFLTFNPNVGYTYINTLKFPFDRSLLTKDLKGIVFKAYLENKNTLWLSLKSSGVYKMTLSKSGISYEKYDTSSGLPDVNEVDIFPFRGKTLFATRSGIYQYQAQKTGKLNETFVPFYGIMTGQNRIEHILQDHEGNIWANVHKGNTQEPVKFEVQKDGSFIPVTDIFKPLPAQQFTFLQVEQDGTVWAAGSRGLFRWKELPGSSGTTYNFYTLIREIQSKDSLIAKGNIDSSLPQLAFPYEENKVSFYFSSTNYDAIEKNTYSVWLEGHDKEWSPWSSEHWKSYNLLKPGKYTFWVKGRNSLDEESEASSVSFFIETPWYMSLWFRLISAMLVIFSIWFFSMLYSENLRKQKRKLQMIIADRTQEIIEQKKEIERQNTILKHKNSEIQEQHNWMERKNVELSRSQREIVAINEALSNMNTQLEQKVNKRTSKIKNMLQMVQETNQELNTFIYKASHDLKGPLSRIRGLVTLLQKEEDRENSAQYINRITDTLEDMEVLLKKLNEVHLIYQQKVKLKEVYIEPIILDITKQYQHNGTKYELEVSKELKAFTDENLLKITLGHLVSNAMNFSKTTSNEGHQIRIKATCKAQKVKIEIEDNGEGIDQEAQSRVFEMFFKGSEKSKGHGLGLYVVQMAVKKIRGKLKIKSERGQGTLVTLNLPLTKASNE